MRIFAIVLATLTTFASYLAFVSAFPASWGIYVAFVIMPVAAWLVTLAHESGHVAGALVAGWRPVTIVAYPFGLHFLYRDLVYIRRENREKLGGWVLAVPAIEERATAARDLALTLGGPLFSLILAIICILTPYLGISPSVVEDSIETHLTVGVGLLSVSAFVITIVPHKIGHITSDGLKVWRIIRNKTVPISQRSVSWLVALRKASVRLRDLPNWMIDALPDDSDEFAPFGRWRDTLRVGRELDTLNPNVAKARQLLACVQLRHGMSHWGTACDAYIAAVYENDLERAQAAIDRIAAPSDTPELTLTAEAAILKRQGKGEAASAKLAEMWRIVRAQSVFRDRTYADLRRQIESLQATCLIEP